MIAYILLVGYPPFYGGTDFEIFERTRKCLVVLHEADWKGVSSVAQDLVLRMLCRSPIDRITTSNILSHAWMMTAPEIHLSDTTARMERLAALKRMKAAGTLSPRKDDRSPEVVSPDLEPPPPPPPPVKFQVSVSEMPAARTTTVRDPASLDSENLSHFLLMKGSALLSKDDISIIRGDTKLEAQHVRNSSHRDVHDL